MGAVIDPGDVVVTPEVRESHLVYVVRTEGSSDRLVYQTRAEAIATAVAYGERAGVNAWYGDRTELGFVPLCRCRLSPAPREVVMRAGEVRRTYDRHGGDS